MNYNLRQLIDQARIDRGLMLNDLIDMGIVDLNSLAKEIVSKRNVRELHYLLMDLQARNLPLDEIVDATIKTKDIHFIMEVTSLMNFLGYKEQVSKLCRVVLESSDVFAMIRLAKTIPGISSEEVFINVLASNNLQAMVSLLKQVNFNKENKHKSAFDIYVEENVSKLLEVVLKPEHLDFLVQTRQELKDATIIAYFNQFIADMVKKSTEQTDLFAYLIELYQKGDFEAIRNNKELFSTLFQDKEEITRGM